MHQIEVNG